jgi:hypothetical protein
MYADGHVPNESSSGPRTRCSAGSASDSSDAAEASVAVCTLLIDTAYRRKRARD